MNNRTVVLTLVLITLVLIPAVSAAGTGTNVIKTKKLVQSQYGVIGDWLGYGDRVYDITYTNGVTQTVFERTTLFKGLKPGTIIQTTGTQWQTAGQPVSVNFRVQGVNLPLFCPSGCTATTHRFELDDITTDYRNILTSAPAQYLLNPLSYQNKVTLTIPAQGAGKRTFLVKEYVLATDGRWIPGAESLSSDMTFDVIWTQSQQSGTSTPIATPSATVAPSNPGYVAPSPAKDIVVDSVPSGATLQVGGGSVGNTPVQLTLFETDGTKTIILTKGGYKTSVSTISYNSPSLVTVTLEAVATFTPQAGSGTGTGTGTGTDTGTGAGTGTGVGTGTGTGTPQPTATSSMGVDYGTPAATSGMSQEYGSEGSSGSNGSMYLILGVIALIVVIAAVVYPKPLEKKGKSGKGKKSK